MNKFKQDIRYALRQLLSNKGFAAVAILTLALGIGANTAIFSVIDSILLEPLPFPHQDRLMQLSAGTDYYNYPKGWIREYQRRAHTFASISGYSQNIEYNVTGGGTTGRAFGSTIMPTCSTPSAYGRPWAASSLLTKKARARTASSCSPTASGKSSSAATKTSLGAP